MALLLIFAFVAGAGTAITPCVLPVLPALLSAGATGGRRRPLGLVVGLLVTFTIAVAALASLVQGVGLADGAARTVAVVVLIAFGMALLLPPVARALERPLARLQRLGPRTKGTGIWSGVAVGGALGFVYAPCAGPILAAVISVSATQGTTPALVAVALAYGLGSAAVLLALALGGRRLMDRVRRAGRGPAVQRALGLVMVLTAMAVAANLDVRFQTALASDFPSVLVNPTRALEESDAVETRLAGLRGDPRFAAPHGPAPPGSDTSLPVLGRAPEFAGDGRWFNTDGGRPLTLAGLRGAVVLIDFWTYTCINCIRTFPALRGWYEEYGGDGLEIVGVHTPEFAFEEDPANVADAIDQNDLRYPVAQDNEYATWDAWGNQYWPAKYLIDADGNVRYTHFGEGGYGETEAAIRALLEEAGRTRLGGTSQARPERASRALATPETYFGFRRAQGFLPPPGLRPGEYEYPGVDGRLPLNAFALAGLWDVGAEAATALRRASVEASFGARRVFLVMSPPPGGGGTARVLLDGRPIPRGAAGADVSPGGRVAVGSERLYELVSLSAAGRHRLRVDLADGVRAYAFTFG